MNKSDAEILAELYSKYPFLHSAKAGVSYERLAAVVVKRIWPKDAVVHNVQLLDDADVSHQIDVDVLHAGTQKRLIIECKDFAPSGKKVGLDIVLKFWAVLAVTPADEAMIITSTDYTKPAAKFADAKGIKRGWLRPHHESDSDDYIPPIESD